MKSIVWAVSLIAAVSVDCRILHGPQQERPPPPTVILDLQPPPTVILDSQHSDDTAELNEDAYMDQVLELGNESPVSADGFYQVDDMQLTEEQWAALRARKAIDYEPYRWTEGTDGYPFVPYLSLGSVNRTAVQLAVNHWREHTCIRLEEDTNPDQPHLEFQIHPQGNGICSSSVGMVSQTGQAVSVGSQCSLGSVIHEIGHAMGFWHEQSRADRDDYVIIRTQNIKPNFTNNFLNFADWSNNYSVPYDYSSIMHYGATYFSTSEQLTIVTKDPSALEIIGQRIGLSHRDKLLANRMYNCTGKWLAKCGVLSDPCLNGGYTGKDCTCICPPGVTGSNCEVVVGDYYDEARNERSEKISTTKRVTVETPMKSGTSFLKSIVPPTCKKAEVTFISSNMYANCKYQLLHVVTNTSDVTGQTLCAEDIESGVTITSETGIFITMINYVTESRKIILWEADVTFENITGCSAPVPPKVGCSIFSKSGGWTGHISGNLKFTSSVAVSSWKLELLFDIHLIKFETSAVKIMGRTSGRKITLESKGDGSFEVLKGGPNYNWWIQMQFAGTQEPQILSARLFSPTYPVGEQLC